jgi:predicted aldo/keto reductase-like oxidoreductase
MSILKILEVNMSDRGIKRREFLGKTALGLVAAGFGLPKLKAGDLGQEQPNKIIYRTLGRTNLRIPVVSFGVMNSDSPDLINLALEKGVNHLDTAHLYLRGNSERVIGEVIENSGKRDKVYIATKMRLARDREKREFSLEGTEREPPATAENLYKQLDLSLKRLKTDYVDILYLHSCYSPQMATYEPLMNALVKVKEQGKVRFIGTSTHADEPNVIRATVDAKVYDVTLTAYNFAQEHKDDVKQAIAYAAKKGVGVIAMKTQGGRRLQEEGEVEIDHRSALKWVLEDENVCTTIPGMTTFEQLETNISVMNDLALTRAERSYLDWAAQMKGKLYCQNCRACIPTCPHRVEIPNLMRAYMYASAYGNFIQARTSISEIPETRSLNVCRNCGSCSAVCRTGINICSRLQSLIADELYLT